MKKKRLKDEIEAYIYIALGLQSKQVKEKQRIFIVQFKDLDRWDIKHNQNTPCIVPFPCHFDASLRHSQSFSCHSEPLLRHSGFPTRHSERSEESTHKTKDNSTSNSGFFANAQNDHTYSHSERSEESQSPVMSSDSETSHRDISLTSLPQNEDTPKYPLVALGEICEVVMGQSPLGSKVFNGDIKQNLKYLEFHQGKIHFTDRYIAKSKMITTDIRKKAQKNSILLCVRAPVGDVNITQREIAIGRGLCSLKSKIDNLNDIYLYYYLYTLKDYLNSKASGSTFKSINLNIVKNLKIPLPPLKIQQEIVEFLENKNQKIQSCKEKRVNLKQSLNEYLEQTLL